MHDWHELREASDAHRQLLLNEAAERRQAHRVTREAGASWRIQGATLLVRLAAWLAPAVAAPRALERPASVDGRL